METQSTVIHISATVNAGMEKVWDAYNNPKHVVNWNFASPDWCCPRAESDLRVGGKFSSRMEARDGSFGFDFEGVYDEVIDHKRIAYSMADGRTVKMDFTDLGNKVKIDIAFDAETMNSIEMQRGGWQAILNNFAQYAEKR